MAFGCIILLVVLQGPNNLTSFIMVVILWQMLTSCSRVLQFPGSCWQCLKEIEPEGRVHRERTSPFSVGIRNQTLSTVPPTFRQLEQSSQARAQSRWKVGPQLSCWLLLFSCVCLTVYVMICTINLCQSYSMSLCEYDKHSLILHVMVLPIFRTMLSYRERLQGHSEV